MSKTETGAGNTGIPTKKSKTDTENLDLGHEAPVDRIEVVLPGNEELHQKNVDLVSGNSEKDVNFDLGKNDSNSNQGADHNAFNPGDVDFETDVASSGNNSGSGANGIESSKTDFSQVAPRQFQDASDIKTPTSEIASSGPNDGGNPEIVSLNQSEPNTGTGGSTGEPVTEGGGGGTNETSNSAPTDISVSNTSIDENSAAGTVVATLSATDSDVGDSFSYALLSDASNNFEIVGNEIRVKEGADLDFENAVSHEITVQVTDSAGNTYSETVTIEVGDLAEEDPSDITFTGGTVDETVADGGYIGSANDPSGTTVATLRATDADAGDTFTYAITNDPSGHYEIVGNEVVVKSGQTIDFETAETHDVTIEVTDASGNTYSETIVINVQDYEGSFTSSSERSQITGTSEEDTMVGNAGNNNLAGGDGNDTISGDGGYNTIDGGAGDDHIDGGTGHDTLYGGDGNDIIGGGSAGDNITGGAGNDTLDGGSYFDYAHYSGNWSDYTITLDGSIFTIVDNRPDSPDGTDTITNFERVTFADGTVSANDFLDVGPRDIDITANSVDENSAAGTVVGTLSATDNALDSHTFVITNDPSGLFEISGDQIVVKAGADIDYEDATSHDITVQVTDIDGNTYSETLTINVADLDEFDVSEVTDTDGSTNTLAENASAGDTIGVVASATDGDVTNNTITYTVDDDRFTVDPDGTVKVASGASFDAETEGSIDISVTATSADGSTSNETFTLAVSDVDEAAVGAITDSNLRMNGIDENASVGDVVGITALASDPDVTDNVTYSLTDDAGGLFTIDGNTGVVTVAGSLDAETATSYTIEVTATSDDNSTSTQNFMIGVNDINETSITAISDNNGTANSVSEGAIVGTAVGVTALATDADATHDVSYSLSSNPGGFFAIDANTGVVTVASGLDYKTDTAHTIQVTATSDDGTTSTQNFTIAVDDVNEAPSDISLSSSLVNENAADGSVVANLTTADVDAGETFSYAITGDASGFFEISGDQVVVKTSADIDFEDATSHDITIEVTDGGGNTYSETVTINVNDLNDEGPSDITFTGGTVNETVSSGGDIGSANDPSGTTVATLSATDADAGDTFTYAITNDPSGHYEIVGNEVVVKSGQTIDFESAASHDVTIEVTDAGGNTYSETITINVNDYEGSYTASGSSETVTGTSEEDTIIMGVGANVVDGGAGDDTITGGTNGETISGGEGNDHLSGGDGHDTINGGAGDDYLDGGSYADRLTGGAGDDTIIGGPVNGVNPDVAVYSGNWSDYTITEDSGTYTIIDNRDGSPDGTDTVTGVESFEFADGSVGVADLINTGPTDISTSDNSVDENSTAGTVVATLSATDADALDSHSYALTNDPSGNFEIVGNEVRVKAGADLNTEDTASHDIVVQVTDANGDTYSETITINVADVDEFDVGTVADTDVSANTVAESASIGDSVGITADASDLDATNNTITYSLSDDAGGLFAVDENTGEVTVAGSLDHETATSHGIEVTASSSDGSSSVQSYTIGVSDVNEAPTDIIFGGNGNLDITSMPDVANTAVVTGEIVTNNAGSSSVDHWAVTHSGGDLVIDVLAYDYNGGDLGSAIYLLLDNGDGTFTEVASNNDGPAGTDGSTSSYDSYISETGLAAGNYILSVGNYRMGSSDAADTADDYPIDNSGNTDWTEGQYQVTISGEATVAYAENPVGGGAWGDPGDNAVVVNSGETVSGGDTLTAGSIVGNVESVVDADSGETFTFALTDDAGGKFEIDENTGDIKLVAEHDASSAYSDTITVQATDSDGNIVTETVGIELGTDGVETITGTSDTDIMHGFGGQDTLSGGAGDDILIDGGNIDVIPDYSQTIASHGPIVHLKLSDSGSTATDETANDHDAIYQGDSQSGATGAIASSDDTSATFDGVGDYVEIPASSDFQVAEGTITLWFNTDSLGSTQSLISRDSHSYDAGGHLNITLDAAGQIDVRHQTASTSEYIDSGSTTVNAGEWHQVTYTWGSDGMQLYLDDTLVDSNSAVMTLEGNNEPFTIGANQWVSGDGVADNLQHHFSGQIDEVAMFDSALSASDIQELNAAGTSELGAVNPSDNGNDTIAGGDGNDTIYAGAGDDIITGGDGDDILIGGSGADSLDGGTGSDTVDYSGAASGVDVAFQDTDAIGANGIMQNVSAGGHGGEADGDSYSSIEAFVGTDHDDNVFGGLSDMTFNLGAGDDFFDTDNDDGNAIDTVNGGAGNDRILGGEGADILSGDSGNDIIFGGDDNDTINGGSGNDTLISENGNDIITGGAGNDSIYGGSGSDIFLFNEGDGADTLSGGAGGGWTDTIQLGDAGGDLGAYGTDWTVSLTSGSIESQDANSLSLSDDADGIVTLDDGSTINFLDIERIEF